MSSLYPIESKLYKLNPTLDPSLYEEKTLKKKKMWPQYQQQATLNVLIKNPSTNCFPNSKNHLEDLIFVQHIGKRFVALALIIDWKTILIFTFWKMIYREIEGYFILFFYYYQNNNTSHYFWKPLFWIEFSVPSNSYAYNSHLSR